MAADISTSKALECRVCDESYTFHGDQVPRLLQCGHTVCHLCLTRIPLHGNFLLCPFDRQPTLLGDSGIFSLKKNFALLELLEKLQTPEAPPSGGLEDLGDEGQQRTRCDEDERHLASVYCTTCATHLCSGCSESTHNTRTLLKHRRVPIGQKPKERPRCAVHPLHLVEFACVEESCAGAPLMCYICRDYGRHQGHKHALLETEAEKVRASLRGALQHVHAFSAEVHDWMRRLDSCIGQIEGVASSRLLEDQELEDSTAQGTVGETRARVREYFATLHADLRRQEVAALSVVDTHVRERLTSLRHQREDMAALVAQVAALSSKCNNTVLQDDGRVLAARKEVHTLLDTIQKQQQHFADLPDQLSLDPALPVTFTKDNRVHIGPKLEMRVVTLGLDGAGKTSLLFRLKQDELVNTIPTIGFNVETVEYRDVVFTIWDVGGQVKLRPLWRHYYLNTQAVVFVVDSTAGGRLEEAQEELGKLLQERELRDASLLVLANKQDVQGALGVNEIVEQLGLPKLCIGRSWQIQLCSARTGDGLAEGLDWLSRQLLATHGLHG